MRAALHCVTQLALSHRKMRRVFLNKEIEAVGFQYMYSVALLLNVALKSSTDADLFVCTVIVTNSISTKVSKQMFSAC